MGPIEVDVAAFTNLSRDHLDYHPDLPSYLAAKRKLLDLALGKPRDKERGRVVVFVDDEQLGAAPWPDATLRVGRRADAQLRLLEASTDRDGSRLRVAWEGGSHRFESRLLGGFNVDNILVALGCGLALGLGIDELQAGLAAAQPVPGRMEPVELEGAPLLLIDYAHTPDGLEAALAASRELCAGRIHLVFGCGGDRDRGKRPLMGEVAVRCADEVYFTLDNPRTEDPAQIFRDAEAGMQEAYARGHARSIEDRAEAIAAALRAAGPEDLIIITGKGHETYQILGETKHPWDDREVLRKAWAAGRTA
jgi:UDP-N-acetylmuramoyl-L-alanyl-D-glutamate--2,6-diaminopimelate ligase